MNTLLLDQQPEPDQASVQPSDTNKPKKPKYVTCSRPTWTTVGLGVFCVAFAVIVCAIFATTTTTSLSGPVASRRTILLVGDSITQNGGAPDGWVSRLQDTYIRSVDVINRGLSSYNTQAFLEKAIPIVSRELETSSAPVLITLWFGANDAALADGPNANQHVPLDEYRANLVKIVNEFQRVAPQAKILVVSPPVVDDYKRRSLQVAAGGQSNPIDRTNKQAGLYGMACGAAVQTLDVGDGRLSFLDLHSYMMTAYENTTSRATLFADGLHLSGEGNRVVFEQVRRRAEEVVGKNVLETPQIPLL